MDIYLLGVETPEALNEANGAKEKGVDVLPVKDVP